MKLKYKITFFALSIIFVTSAIVSFLSIYNMKKFENTIIADVKKTTLQNTKKELKDYVNIIMLNLDNLLNIYEIDPEKISKHHMDILFNDYLIPLYEKYKNDKNIKEILLKFISKYRYKFSSLDTKRKGFFIVVDKKSRKILSHFNKAYINKCPDEIDPKRIKLLQKIDQYYQGFAKVKCENPFTGKKEQKHIFIKNFNPFNWIIITGVYQSDLESIENKLYDIIKKIRFENKDYFFGYKVVDKKHIYYIFHPFLTGRLDLNQTDIKGNHYKKTLVQNALNGGGFVTYYFKNPATGKIEQKLTYSVYYPRLKLIIATGAYLQNVENLIKAAKIKINSYVTKTICQMLLLSVLMLFVSFILFNILISKFLIKPIEEINQALEYIQKARIEDEIPDELDIDEVVEEFAYFTQNVEKNLKDFLKILKGI